MSIISSELALAIDTAATFVCQSGYIVQKKAHQSVESYNSQQVREEDRKSGFITCTWVLGFLLSMFAAIVHASMTAFADIVLLSFNAATAIIIQVVLSMVFLKEVFIWRYDLPALILIISGSTCIIMTANFSELHLDVDTIKGCLTSVKSIAFYVVAFMLLNCTFVVVKKMLQYLAIFEHETERFLNLQHVGMDSENSGHSRHSQLLVSPSGLALGVETQSSQCDDHEVSQPTESEYFIQQQRDNEVMQLRKQKKEPRRPARLLLGLVGKMSDELIDKISPKYGRRLRRFIKLPVVLLTLSSGVCGGTSLVQIKSFGEIVGGSELSSNFFLSLLLVAMGLGCSAMQVYLLNLSMKYYNNTDVMPIYQSFVLINWMVSGLVLLDESSLYTFFELLRLGASCLLVILGIFVLTLKQSEIAREEFHNTAGSSLSSSAARVNQPLLSSERGLEHLKTSKGGKDDDDDD